MKGFARTANRGKSRNIAKSFAILRENVGSQFRSLHYGIEARHVMGTAIIVAGLMGAAGIILAAAGAHAASRAGLDSAGYILLFHAAALLGGSAVLQHDLVWRPLGLLAFAAWAFGAILFSADVALRAFVGHRLFPMAAPAGGIILLAGWLIVAAAALVALVGRH